MESSLHLSLLSESQSSSDSMYKRGSIPGAHAPANAKDIYTQFARETRCSWIGPMPIDIFLEEFLKNGAREHEDRVTAQSLELFANIPQATEVDMYPILVGALLPSLWHRV